MRTDREEAVSSFGGYIGMPPVSCGAGHSGHCISMLAAREQDIHRADTRT
jgi:hypothetical protein